MISKTKTVLAPADIHNIFSRLFSNREVIAIAELKDGCFNTSYGVSLDNEEEYVLKVSPPSGVQLLSYEKNMMHTELLFHSLCEQETTIAIPKIINSDISRKLIPFDYFIMEKLHGTPLDKIVDISFEQRKSIFIQLADSLARMHRIKGDYFGYPVMSNQFSGKSYFESFSYMIDRILHDGRVRKVNLPVSEEDLWRTINQYKSAFDHITEPVFVHYDLWDGNIFVQNMDTAPEIEGLIDFERGYYADPAADFSQVAGYIDLEKNSWFLEEYNKHAEKKFIVDEDAKIRIKLFRFYLFLIMIVESYYRDVEGSYNEQLKWSEEELVKLYKSLT